MAGVKEDKQRSSNTSQDLIVVHACCAPCLTTVIDRLSSQYRLVAVFYNPNIHPHEEYERRLAGMDYLCAETGTRLITLEYDSNVWTYKTRGLEDEPEGGKRCELCFYIRLARTAQITVQLGINIFTTTLTVSPHKHAGKINSIGRAAAAAVGIEYLDADFKKQDGFKKSCELSSKYGLYRQHYCGCMYSAGLGQERML